MSGDPAQFATPSNSDKLTIHYVKILSSFINRKEKKFRYFLKCVVITHNPEGMCELNIELKIKEHSNFGEQKQGGESDNFSVEICFDQAINAGNYNAGMFKSASMHLDIAEPNNPGMLTVLQHTPQRPEGCDLRFYSNNESLHASFQEFCAVKKSKERGGADSGPSNSPPSAKKKLTFFEDGDDDDISSSPKNQNTENNDGVLCNQALLDCFFSGFSPDASLCGVAFPSVQKPAWDENLPYDFKEGLYPIAQGINARLAFEKNLAKKILTMNEFIIAYVKSKGYEGKSSAEVSGKCLIC